MTVEGRIVVVFNDFPKITAEMRPAAERVVEDTAVLIADRAAVMAPVDTGYLSDSIEAHRVGPLHWQVTADARYAAYVEYGTEANGPAQPYMTPIAHQEEVPFRENMKTIVTGR